MFSSTIRLVSSSAALTLALGVSALADGGVRLTTVAAQNGFTYQWIPTEAGAMLARPGVRIVIRAGRLFYEVNNATPVADVAPRFDGRDLVISEKLAEHLREIARKYPNPEANGMSDVASGDAPVEKPADVIPTALSLHARQIPGREAIAYRGSGPAGVAVTITVTGEISTDLPIVVLARKTVTTATDGSFSAEVEYGQESHMRTTIAATATTLSGASSAEARVLVGVTSPQIKSGLDDWPKK